MRAQKLPLPSSHKPFSTPPIPLSHLSFHSSPPSQPFPSPSLLFPPLLPPSPLRPLLFPLNSPLLLFPPLLPPSPPSFPSLPPPHTPSVILSVERTSVVREVNSSSSSSSSSSPADVSEFSPSSSDSVLNS